LWSPGIAGAAKKALQLAPDPQPETKPAEARASQDV
jgi:hypothetical protein